MSNRFNYPFNPINWPAVPIDHALPNSDAPIMGIYTTETTQRYIPGTRYTMWDGRVFKYGKTGAANYSLNNDFACQHGQAVAQAYDQVNTTNAIGDTSFVMDGGTHTTFEKDELAGGYAIIYYTGGGGNTQFRGITGNDYSYTNLDVTIYVDAPLAVETVGATTACEIWHNPYTGLATGATKVHAFAGKPVVQVTTASTYFWLQTWGMCWMAHDSATSALTTHNLEAKFLTSGAYSANYGYSNLGGGFTNQTAGIAIVRNAGPLLLMQISV